MPSQSIPITTNLNEIYTPTSLLNQASRWNNLLESFEKEFDQTKVEFVVRAPGRVNIIGEHIGKLACWFSLLHKQKSTLILFWSFYRNTNLFYDLSRSLMKLTLTILFICLQIIVDCK